MCLEHPRCHFEESVHKISLSAEWQGDSSGVTSRAEPEKRKKFPK